MKFWLAKEKKAQTPTRDKRGGADVAHILRLCAIYLLVVSLIVVPVTFSKYVSTTNGVGENEIAGIEYNVYYEAKGYSFDLNDYNNSYKQVYIIALDFTIDNGTSDVSYDYELNLTLDSPDENAELRYTSFNCPFTKEEGKTPTKVASLVNIEGDNSTKLYPIGADYTLTFAEGYAYYYDEAARMAIAYTDGILGIEGRFNVTEATVSHKYSVLVFVDLTSLESIASFEMEDFEILYDVTCTQID